MFSPIFKGQLVCLSTARPEDQEVFARWSQDDHYMRLLDDDPVRPQPASAYDHFGAAPRENDYYFHLRTLTEDELIGFVVLFNIKWRNQTSEMAIGIGAEAYRGKGYGHDALQLILRYGFSELGLRRVGLTVLSYNAPAIKAYERVGFKHEGTIRQAIFRDGQHFDLLQYGILRDEWLTAQHR